MSDNSQKNGKGLSRRDFLKTTGGATAMAGIAASNLVLDVGKADAAEIPKKWNEEADVVIIGSGFAGLAAAIEAKNAGSSVIVLEKMQLPGGNSIISGGGFSIAGSAMQEKEGIKDSPELMYQDMLTAGLGLNHCDLARIVAEKSRETADWTIKYLGVRYKESVLQVGGHAVPRSILPTNDSGSGIVRPQLAKLQELGVTVTTGRLLERLFKDGDGRVKGIQIRDKYVFPKENSGIMKYIKARKAVVLATGGFGYDLAFRTIQDPRLTKDLDSTNQPGATAEGLLEALRINATPVQISWIQLGPWACPDEKGFGIGPWFNITTAFPYGVMVDPATGKRFINEMADRKARADAMLKTGHYCISIADQECVKHTPKLDTLIERSIVKKFNTLEELSGAYSIPSRELEETIKNYNLYVKQGKDDEFGKPFQKGSKPLIHPPYYGMRSWPKVHHTMGGIQINTKAQVIDLSRKPIKGLYAAGEVAGGVHGACRLGGCAITECLIFGRIAGKNAAAEESWG